MKGLGRRIISGLIFGGVVIGGFLFNVYSYSVVCFILVALMIHEFHQLTRTLRSVGDKGIPWREILTGGILLVGSILIAAKSIEPLWAIAAAPLVFLLLILPPLFFDRERPFNSIAFGLAAMVYLVLPFMVGNVVAFDSEGTFRGEQLLMVFFLLWTFDVWAYLVGSNLGRHPLFKRVSPKKSVEGVIGGAVVTGGIAWVGTLLFEWFTPQLAFSLSAVVVVFGTVGDLVESLLKRSLEIKDSGTIMPGHGGIMDRLDGLVFVLPFAALVYIIFA